MRGSKPTDALRTLPERAFRLRARLIAVGLCAVCFAGLIGRLFWLQLCTGGWYTQRALGQQLRDTVVPADRGKIYSADGALLAANSSCWTLRASPREMPEEKLALAAKGLAEILELDEAKLLEKFSDRRSNDCLLRYRVEREIADAVRDFCAANGITGVRINQDSKRWYPQGEFLASVLGFTNVDNAGVSGLELKYNDTLTGQNGVVLTAVNAWGYTLAQSYETELTPVEGSGLRLTIDANIQHYLENALNYAVQEHHVAARSVGIVMEVNTSVSTPSCSARRNVPSATALSPAPVSPGNRGLPEQFRAEIVRPFSPRVSSSRCRAPASAVSLFRSTWGAGDQLPQPNSTCSSPSPRQTAAASARERSARLSVTKPSFMSIPPPSSFLIP